MAHICPACPFHPGLGFLAKISENCADSGNYFTQIHQWPCPSITIDSDQVILITCSERLIDGKQLRKNDKPDVDNKIVKVRRCSKYWIDSKQVNPFIVPNPSEEHLTKQMDKIQVISMIGEKWKPVEIDISSSGTHLVPFVVCLAASIFWAFGLLFHFDVILTYNI